MNFLLKPLKIADTLGEVTQTPAARSEKARAAKLLRDRMVQSGDDSSRRGPLRVSQPSIHRQDPLFRV